MTEPDREPECEPDCEPDCSPGGSEQAVFVATFPMTAGARFDWHTHPDHQVAWASAGVLAVETHAATWVLPPTRALWIPAGLPHETRSSSGPATMCSLYIRPEQTPISWPDPTPIAARPLLVELIGYLAEPMTPESRVRAEALLADLLEPVRMNTIEVRLPDDDRARAVAVGLRRDPADGRTLEQWGRSVGASTRTLERSFLTETGIPFGRWRTLLRLQAALPALAARQAVSTVARHVGYETPSAFVAAFRRETGLTPAAYFRQDTGQ